MGLLSLALLAAGSPSAAQQAATPVSPGAAIRPAPRFLVVLDAAHGGDDSGAQLANGVVEKSVTLELSVRLRSLLTARGFQVVTTREGNVTMGNDARAQVANHGSSLASASACVSLHATESGSGVHIFVSSLAPASYSRFLAWKTAQAPFVTRSLKLASVVNSALAHGSDTPIPANLARTSLPAVDSMACPAIAIGIAPIRGDDRKALTEVSDPQYQNQIVESLAAAMLEWRTEQESENSRGEAHSPGERTP